MTDTNKLADSLTGWEELAIKRAFGVAFGVMGTEPTKTYDNPNYDPIMVARALAAVAISRRDNPAQSGPVNPTEFQKAYHEAMGLRESEVEAVIDEAEAVEGKAESQEPTTTSPPSASSPESPPGTTPI